jgi:predicted dienelactone hydrolase
LCIRRKSAGDAKAMRHRDYLEIRLGGSVANQVFDQAGGIQSRGYHQRAHGQTAKELTDPEKLLLDQFLDTLTPCIRNAPHAEGKFPLVIYHSGNGSSFEDNSVLCEFLASHGYVVLGSAFSGTERVVVQRG